jgi:hypothetical protein
MTSFSQSQSQEGKHNNQTGKETRSKEEKIPHFYLLIFFKKIRLRRPRTQLSLKAFCETLAW